MGERGRARLKKPARQAERGEAAKRCSRFPEAQLLQYRHKTGWTDTMTRRWQRQSPPLFHEQPAEPLLPPGTFTAERVLAPVLVSRLEYARVLAKRSALPPYIFCAPHP